jgi:phosphopantetheine adenylyltransferase
LSLITAFVITHQVTLNITSDDNLITDYYYVAHRNSTPDQNTLKRVKEELEKRNIDIDQLKEWQTANCL